jgi:HEAT repeat protein
MSRGRYRQNERMPSEPAVSIQRQLDRALRARRRRLYWSCVSDIQETGSRDAFKLASAMLRSRDARRRRLGADVLGELGYQQFRRPFARQSARILLAAVRRERSPAVLPSLVTALGRLSIRSAIPALVPLAKHSSPDVRRAVAAELSGCTWDTGDERPDRRVTAVLVDLTRDPMAEVRGWACFSLAGSGADSAEIRSALWERVHDRHYDTRIDALRALAIRRDPRVHQPLRDAVRDIGIGRFGSWVMDDLVEYAKSVRDRRLVKALKS